MCPTPYTTRKFRASHCSTHRETNSDIRYRLGTDIDRTIPQHQGWTAPQVLKIRYRGQSRGESHLILDANAIGACARAFQQKIEGYVASGRAWDSSLDERMYSEERDMDSNGVYLAIKPATFRIFPTSLETAWALLQTVIEAATDTTIIPQGFVEEAYMDSFRKFEGVDSYVAIGPMRMAKGNSRAGETVKVTATLRGEVPVEVA